MNESENMNDMESRSIDAVIHPNHYQPLPNIKDQSMFEDTWLKKPMGIFAGIAHSAYLDLKDLTKIFSRFGASVKFFESKGDNSNFSFGRQAFLIKWADKAILAFRGTESSEKLTIKTPAILTAFFDRFSIRLPEEIKTFLSADWMDNFKLAKKLYHGAKFHLGFFTATMSLWEQIHAELVQLPKSIGREIYVTGHSLGGAMAVMASTQFSFKKIVTFGEPRNGIDTAKAIQGNPEHIRFVNGDDPVPEVVPSFWPFSYQHHGEKVSIVDRQGPNPIYDHSILNYAELLLS